VAEFSEAFKSKMVQRMLGPERISANALAAQVDLSQTTLSRWRREAEGTMRAMPKKVTPPKPTIARRPEDWSSEERLRVVAESSRLSEEELGAFLRREGLHEETVKQWRAAALEGLVSQRADRSDQKRVRELEKELKRKDRALAEAAALLLLEKKLQALWGAGDDDTGPKNDK
jgi:transposase